MSSNLKIKRICAWCGKEFIAQKTTTACCSKQCANALYKKKKRDEAIKANNQIVEKKIEEKPIERIKDKYWCPIKIRDFRKNRADSICWSQPFLVILMLLNK